MGKDFLKLKADPKRETRLIAVIGSVVTIALGILSYQEQKLGNETGLLRPKAGETAYEQELLASVAGEKEYPVTITVSEHILSKEEAENRLETAEEQLKILVLGENARADEIRKDLKLPQELPELGVEILWNTGASKYFDANGSIREENRPEEAVLTELLAMLTCQEYSKDFSMELTLMPRENSEAENFYKFLENSEETTRENAVWELPKTYNGKKISWKKPLDLTFLYFGLLTAGAVLLLKLGSKKDDKKQQKERLAQLERDYAQIVGKFAMLLSAGLSVRNAWERIVNLQRKNTEAHRAVYEEMSWALKELQKGSSELWVYEQFGIRTAQVHYKKLMALFISEQRHGGARLLEAMEQEMLEAWEEQKRKTRQQGEQISTKLLVPMMGMLGVVFLMILIPAFLSFQI